MKAMGFDKFYPSSVLVTGFDIIFFWVARMMMIADKVTGQAPFSDTYIHAIVRDKSGVKMSKSLGNVMDPLDLIKDYGCDALRFTLAVSSGYNRNINLDPAKIEGYRNFVNKLWNAFRFIHPYLENTNDQEFEIEDLHHHEKWILTELNLVIEDVTKSFDIYRFDDACNSIYHFVYEKFCSWFIEVSKGILNSNNENLKTQRANILRYCFRQIVKLLHPVIPFITEEMWSHLKREDEDLLIVQEFPEYDSKFEFSNDKDRMDHFMEIVTAIRNLRNNAQLKPKDEVKVSLFTDDEALAKYFYQSRGFLKELAGVISGNIKDKKVDRPTKSIMKATTHTEVFISLDGLIDLDGYIARLKKDHEKTQKEFDKVSNKLKNPKFVENAPDEIIAKVKEEANAFKEKLESLTSNIERLG